VVTETLEDGLAFQGENDCITGEEGGIAAVICEYWDQQKGMGKGFKHMGLGCRGW
jgi:hypothetical protein